MKKKQNLLLLIVVFSTFALSVFALSPGSQQTVNTSQPAIYVTKTAEGEIAFRYREQVSDLKGIITQLEKLNAYGTNIELLIFVQDEVDMGSFMGLLKELRRIKWKRIVLNFAVKGVLTEEISLDEIKEESILEKQY
jgi:biopolymer transport protein ExbD